MPGWECVSLVGRTASTLNVCAARTLRCAVYVICCELRVYSRVVRRSACPSEYFFHHVRGTICLRRVSALLRFRTTKCAFPHANYRVVNQIAVKVCRKIVRNVVSCCLWFPDESAGSLLLPMKDDTRRYDAAYGAYFELTSKNWAQWKRKWTGWHGVFF